MAPVFSDLKYIKFYNNKNIKCEAKVVDSDFFKKNYIGLYKYFTYTTAEGLYKESNSNDLYAIQAAKELISVISCVIANAEQLTEFETVQDKNSSPATNGDAGESKQPAFAAKSDALDKILHDIFNAGANLYSAASLIIEGGGLGLSECLGRAREGLQPSGSWISRQILDFFIDVTIA